MVKNPVKTTELVVQVSLLVAVRKDCRGRKTPPGGGLFGCRSNIQEGAEWKIKKKSLKRKRESPINFSGY